MSWSTRIAVVASVAILGALPLGIYVAFMDSDSGLEVPQFGEPTEPKEVADGESGREFIAFLHANEAKKVYINVSTSQAPDDLIDPESSLSASGLVLRDDTNKTNPVQHIRLLKDGRHRYEVHYGAAYGWLLRGYFAVDGLVSARMGLEIRDLVPIDLDDAVN